jgi:hypothetical protein
MAAAKWRNGGGMAASGGVAMAAASVALAKAAAMADGIVKKMALSKENNSEKAMKAASVKIMAAESA